MRPPHLGAYWLGSSVWILVGLLLGGVGVYALKPDATPAKFEQPAPPPVAEQAFSGAQINWVGSGTFQVPAQAPPGRYLITPSGSVLGCIWKRLKSTDGKPKSVIAQGSPNRGASDEIVIASSDHVFEMLGDCTLGRA